MTQIDFHLQLNHNDNWSMSRLHFHDYCEFLLPLTSPGNIFVNDQVYPLRRGTLYLIGENTLHRTIATGFHARYVLHISRKALSALSTPQTDFSRMAQSAFLRADMSNDQMISLIERFQALERNKNDGAFGSDVHQAIALLDLLLYRSRRSETAGDVVAVGWLRPVFRYGVAGLCALLGGQLLYSLFWYGFQQGAYYDTLPMVVCLLAAGTIGYYGASMLLAKSLRVFRGSWRGLAIVLAGCALVCCVLHFDLLGVADRVPKASQIRSVDIRVSDNSYTFTPEQDADLVEQVRALHQAVAAEEAYIRETEAAGYTSSMEESPDNSHTGLSITYTLKSGAKVDRWYFLPITRDRMAQPGTYDHLLDQFVNSEAMKARRLHLDDGFWTVTGGSLFLSIRDQYYDLGSREASAILEAVGRDMEAGNWGTYDWFASDNGGDYALELSLYFDGPDGEGHDYITVVVCPAMTETAQCLKRLGLASDEDLVTYRELYPQDYLQDYEDTAYYGAQSGNSTAEVYGASGGVAVSPL